MDARTVTTNGVIPRPKHLHHSSVSLRKRDDTCCSPAVWSFSRALVIVFQFFCRSRLNRCLLIGVLICLALHLLGNQHVHNMVLPRDAFREEATNAHIPAANVGNTTGAIGKDLTNEARASRTGNDVIKYPLHDWFKRLKMGHLYNNDVKKKQQLPYQLDLGLTPLDEPIDYCKNNPDIYYVKVHKTGSSTFQNILYRLGISREQYFALFKCKYGMAYPHPAKQEYLYDKPLSPNFRHYNLITDHTQLDSEAYKRYMPRRTQVITLLRHPLHQLKSAFQFWGLASRLKIPKRLNNGDAVLTYLSNTSYYERPQDSFGCLPKIKISLTRNAQSHHLGLQDQSVTDDATIDAFVRRLNSTLDHVLILERFDESLLLLKRKYCLTLKDIVHLKLYGAELLGRRNDRLKVSARAETLQRDWSRADYALYDFYSAALERDVTQQGVDFRSELYVFRSVQQSVRNYCKQSCSVFDRLRSENNVTLVRGILSETFALTRTAYSEPFNVTRADCALMMIETHIYNDAFRQRQWPEACANKAGDANRTSDVRLPKLKQQYCDESDYFVLNFPWSVLRKSLYFIERKCLQNL